LFDFVLNFSQRSSNGQDQHEPKNAEIGLDGTNARE